MNNYAKRGCIRPFFIACVISSIAVLLFGVGAATSFAGGSPGGEALVPTAPPHGKLVITGHVLLADGTGVPGVAIYRSFESGPGVVEAITDNDGYYLSGKINIDKPVTVTVWAVNPGYIFDPPGYSWRQYPYDTTVTLDFSAIALKFQYIPIVE